MGMRVLLQITTGVPLLVSILLCVAGGCLLVSSVRAASTPRLENSAGCVPGRQIGLGSAAGRTSQIAVWREIANGKFSVPHNEQTGNLVSRTTSKQEIW